MDLLKFDQFLNETNITTGKIDMTLELNKKGELLPPFVYFNKENYYYILKYINTINFHQNGEHLNNKDYRILLNNKVTKLTPSTYKDNESIEGSRNRLDINRLEGLYFIYKIKHSEIKVIDNEKEGITINYDDDKNRFENTVINNKSHYILIKQNTNVNTIRLNSNQRYGFGSKAEVVLSKRFGWILKPTKIESKEIIKLIDEKSVIKKILTTNDNDIPNLVHFDTGTTVFNKYDLVIEDENGGNDKFIEVKKYNTDDLFYKKDNHESKPILIAEQLKIATKQSLLKIIKIYLNEYDNIDDNDQYIKLIEEIYNIDKGDTLGECFRKNANIHNILNNIDINNIQINYDIINRLIVDINLIKQFYNKKVKLLLHEYKKSLSMEIIMKKVYGIYFFSDSKGMNGFLLKSTNINRKPNFEYYWQISDSHWGLNRIQLMAKIVNNPYKYIWLGDESKFIKTYNILDNNYPFNISDENITYDYTKITVQWNSQNGYWSRVDYIGDPGVGIHLNKDNKIVKKIKK